MNKSELIDQVARTADLGKRQAEAAVDALVQAVISETKAGNRIALSGFGTFSPTARAARMGRNPQTGEPVKIAASKGVKFSPATAFKSELNPKGKKAGASKASAKKATAKKAPAKKTAAKKAPAKKAAKSTKKR